MGGPHYTKHLIESLHLLKTIHVSLLKRLAANYFLKICLSTNIIAMQNCELFLTLTLVVLYFSMVYSKIFQNSGNLRSQQNYNVTENIKNNLADETELELYFADALPIETRGGFVSILIYWFCQMLNEISLCVCVVW